MYEGTKKLAEEVAGSVGNYRTMVERGETEKMSSPQKLQAYEQSLKESFGNYKVHLDSLSPRITPVEYELKSERYGSQHSRQS